MGQPVVLPKFELPGDKPHWAVRAAWITSGVLLLSIVGLGAVIVHHRNLQTEAHLAKARAIAQVKADAEAKVAMAAAEAKAKREAELAAKLAAQAPRPSAPPGAEGAGLNDGSPAAKPAKASRGHRGRSSHPAKGTRMAAKSGGKPDSGGKPSTRNDDAIDALLKKMK